MPRTHILQPFRRMVIGLAVQQPGLWLSRCSWVFGQASKWLSKPYPPFRESVSVQSVSSGTREDDDSSLRTLKLIYQSHNISAPQREVCSKTCRMASRSRLFEIARMLMRFDHVASRIVATNDSREIKLNRLAIHMMPCFASTN